MSISHIHFVSRMLIDLDIMVCNWTGIDKYLGAYLGVGSHTCIRINSCRCIVTDVYVMTGICICIDRWAGVVIYIWIDTCVGIYTGTSRYSCSGIGACSGITIYILGYITQASHILHAGTRHQQPNIHMSHTSYASPK